MSCLPVSGRAARQSGQTPVTLPPDWNSRATDGKPPWRLFVGMRPARCRASQRIGDFAVGPSHTTPTSRIDALARHDPARYRQAPHPARHDRHTATRHMRRTRIRSAHLACETNLAPQASRAAAGSPAARIRQSRRVERLGRVTHPREARAAGDAGEHAAHPQRDDRARCARGGEACGDERRANVGHAQRPRPLRSPASRDRLAVRVAPGPTSRAARHYPLVPPPRTAASRLRIDPQHELAPMAAVEQPVQHVGRVGQSVDDGFLRLQPAVA